MSEPRAASARRAQRSSAPNARWARRPRAAQAAPGVEDYGMSIPLRRSRIGVIDDASVAVRETRDLGHLCRGEFEVENREIFRQSLEAAGPRDDRDACAAVLPCALPMRASTVSLFTPPRAIGL